MKIIIRAAGILKRGPERDLFDNYLERAQIVGRNLGFTAILESEVDVRGAKTRANETDAILAITQPTDILVVLDERGKAVTSQQMATQLARWRDDGFRKVVIAIGAADGFEPSALRADVIKWQLGKLTWPHKLVRVMIGEQIYRALSILAGTPYHRD